MCTEHDHAPPTEGGPPRHSRRAFLSRVAAAAGGAVFVPEVLRGVGSGSPAYAVESGTALWSNPTGETAYRAALHLHGSFSEGRASWGQHFHEAARTGVHILVPTEHDWRVEQRHYARDFHFSDWTERPEEGVWRLEQLRATPNLTAESGATLTTRPAPADLEPGAGALRLMAQSKWQSKATLMYELDCSSARGSAYGRTVQVWVKPVSQSKEKGYLGIQIGLARDPQYGMKRILYRLRTDLDRRGRNVKGGSAVIDIPVTKGEWNPLTFDVVRDAGKCWPDLDPHDNNLNRIIFVATGKKWRKTKGLFSYLDLVPDPALTREQRLQALVDVIARHKAATTYPPLLVPHGMEHSVDLHMNQIGGTPFLYPFEEATRSHTDLGDEGTKLQVKMIREQGGVVSYNHPFGTAFHSPADTGRTKKLHKVMTSLLESRCYDMDVVEVGYIDRGMDLDGHIELFDCLVANGMYLTATGVSDDHQGNRWDNQVNRFVTIPWMATKDEEALKTALRGGRATVGLLGNFTGAMDMSLGGARMGQVYTGEQEPFELIVEAYGLPEGATLHVWSGPIDRGGVDFQRPLEVFTLDLPAAGGAIPVPITGTGARYYRCTVMAGGRIVAFTNPVWRVPPEQAESIPPHRLPPAQ